MILAGLVLALLPVTAVVGLLVVAAWRDRRRAEAVARQVAVTDAIHRELGAVVAPTVERGAGNAWRLRIPVPFDRPELIASVIGVANQTTRTLDGHALRAGATRARRPMEVVLTPQEEHRACA